MKLRPGMGALPRTAAVIAMLALGVASGLGGDAPANLLANGSFDDGQKGWEPGVSAKGVSFDWTKDGGRGAGGALHIQSQHGSGAQPSPWIWWGSVESPPADAALKISGWIRGKGVHDLAAICVQAFSSDGAPVGFATTPQDPPLKGDFDWTYVKTVLPATPKLGGLKVLAFLAGDGEAWFDDLRVERTDEKPVEGTFEGPPKEEPASRRPAPPPAWPGLMVAKGQFDVRAGADVQKPRVLIPLPLSYREQVPVTYDLRTDPDGGLAAARIYEDSPGNWVIEATFRAMKPGEEIHVAWRSLVLCGARSFADVPENAPIPAKWPDEASPWLRSTRCVQSAELRFAAIAKELRDGTDDAREIIRRVLARAGEAYRGAKGDVTELTALEALDKQGSCTSCANLVAALLRACGVPARVLSGYPLWSGPLQTHYIVEAYVPGYGWYPIESSALREAWQPYEQVEVSIVPTKYEDASQPRHSGAGGVPYLSLTEVQGDDLWALGTIEDAPGCDHVAEQFRALPTERASAAWTSAIEAAGKRWGEWLAHAKLDDKGRLATGLQPSAVTAKSAAELTQQLSR